MQGPLLATFKIKAQSYFHKEMHISQITMGLYAYNKVTKYHIYTYYAREITTLYNRQNNGYSMTHRILPDLS